MWQDGTVWKWVAPCNRANYPYPFAFDSIIAGVDSDLVQFNEIFICPNVKKKMAQDGSTV
jgi:hypothetical protein